MNISKKLLTLKRFLLDKSAIIITALLIVVAASFYIKSNRLAEDLNRSQSMVATQITLLNQHIQAERSLENKVRELEATIKRVVSTSNKIEQARPRLVDWVYKHSRISRVMAEKIVDNVKESSSPLFLLALMRTESNFNPTAVSSKGAMGLGQIMPVHKKALKESGIIKELRDLFNISTAIKATEFIWELKMVDARGDINKALALYLGAHDGKYVNRILKDYFQLSYLCQKPLLEQKIEQIQAINRVGAAPMKDGKINKMVGHLDKKLGIEQKVYKKAQPTKMKAAPTKEMPEEINKTIVGEVIYIVKEGDSLSKIAQRTYGGWNLGILNTIKSKNLEIKNIDLIFVDQKIMLPIINMGTKEVREPYRGLF